MLSFWNLNNAQYIRLVDFPIPKNVVLFLWTWSWRKRTTLLD